MSIPAELLQSIFNFSSTYISSLITSHGYVSVFFLMLLESASLPVPSEIVMPVAGALAAHGSLNIMLVLLFAFVGSFIGMGIDYYIGYFLGKDVVYKHAHLFHIKKSTLEMFDRWFANNGEYAVFVGRMIPVVRGLISFPAGFALMDKKDFFVYSMAGTVIWEVALAGFGFYALSQDSYTVISIAISAFVIVMVLIYKYAMDHVKKNSK